MADLKIGTTIGGTPIWGKVNLPLTPSGDTLMYKTFKLYSEYDKPTPAEINALSKAGDVGNGTYTFISNDAPLIMQAKTADAANYLLSKDSSGNNNWFFGKAGAGNNLTMKSYALNTEMQFRADDVLFNKQITTTSGIRSAYAITTFNTSNNLGLVLSTNGGGYSELVRIGNDQAYEWGYGLRAYGNDDWRIGVARLYHQGFKPTAADVNAWSKTESDARFVQMTGINKAQGAILSRSYNYFDNGGTISDFDYSGFFRTNGKDGTPALMINCAHSGARAHGRGVGFDYGSSAGDQAFSMYSYAFDAEGNYLGHARVYTTKYKPTAADVGLPNVPNTVHSANADANTVAVRDGAADLQCRLVRSNYGNETRIEGAIAFRINTTDNYIRFCSDPGAVRRWLSLDVGNSPTFQNITNQGNTLSLWRDGRRHIAFQSSAGTDAYIYKDPDATPLKINHAANALGGAELQIGRNAGITITGRLNKTVDGEASAALRCTPEGHSWDTWRASNSALQIDCPESDGSAYNIWKATHWGARHIACMQVHWGGSGYVKMNVGNSDFTFDGSGGLTAGGNGNFNDVYIRSDVRVKSGFLPITQALHKANKLSGKTYDKHASLTDDTIVAREAGLIAQDVEKVLPEAVHTLEDGTKTISHSAINALLVEAIKELTKRVEELENGRS